MPDIISPSTIEINGEAVTTAAPAPATIVAAVAPGTAQIISPRNWCVNGDIVSDSNPFPISLA